MRDFKFICQLCRHRVQTRTVYAGELIACPVCEGEIVIPQPPASPDDDLPLACPPGQAAKPKTPDAPAAKPAPANRSPLGGGYSFGPPPPKPSPAIGTSEPTISPAKTAPSSVPSDAPPRPGTAPGLAGQRPPVETPASSPPSPPPSPEKPPVRLPPSFVPPSEPAKEPAGGKPDSASEASAAKPPPPPPADLAPKIGPAPAVTGGTPPTDRGPTLPAERALIRIPRPSAAPPEPSPAVPSRPKRSDLTPPLPVPPLSRPSSEPAAPKPVPGLADGGKPAPVPAPSRPAAAPTAGTSREPSPTRGAPLPPGSTPAGLAAARPTSPPLADRPSAPALPEPWGRAASPFQAPPPAATQGAGELELGRRPHTGLLFLALNVLVILVVVVVMLIPKDEKSPASRGPGFGANRLPAAPNWNLAPAPTPARTLTETDVAQAREAVNGLLEALGRRDLLGAARWIIPSASVGEVTNRLTGLADELAGTPASAWRVDAPRTNGQGGFAIIVAPLATNVTGQIELELEAAAVGWRVAGLNLRLAPAGSPTNVSGARLDFRPPKAP